MEQVQKTEGNGLQGLNSRTASVPGMTMEPEVMPFIDRVKQVEKIKNHEIFPKFLDIEIQNFWIANKKNEDEAIEAIYKTLEWRKEFRFYELDTTKFPERHAIGKLRKVGISNQGVPVYAWTSFLHKPTTDAADCEEEIRYLFSIFIEGLVKRGTYEKVIIVINREHSGMKQADFQLVKVLSKIFPPNLPETLCALYVYPTNALARYLFKVASMFLDPVTVAKVHFIQKNEEAKLFEMIDENLIKPFLELKPEN